MRRWPSVLFISLYLGCLGFGFFAHSMKFLSTAHPAMYFVVWDMYCGWSAYETRVHLVGQGESGRYYEIAPTAWGAFQPYGSCDRIDYDGDGLHCRRIAQNILDHTSHEPIHRVFVIEENWPKKFNLPDHLWPYRFAEAKAPHSYYHLRSTYNAQGDCLQNANPWIADQYQMAVLDNTRLRRNAVQGQTYFATDSTARSSTGIVPASFEIDAADSPDAPATRPHPE